MVLSVGGKEEDQVMTLILVDRGGLAYPIGAWDYLPISAEINEVEYCVRWSHTPVRYCIEPKACLVEWLAS